SQDYHILTAHIILDDLNEFKSVLQKLNALLKNEFNIHHITIQPETI
ncbi:cation transporter, partial [Campylobacter sp. RM12637]|nr:cation transporter [Campylobacter sp. RM12637]